MERLTTRMQYRPAVCTHLPYKIIYQTTDCYSLYRISRVISRTPFMRQKLRV